MIRTLVLSAALALALCACSSHPGQSSQTATPASPPGQASFGAATQPGASPRSAAERGGTTGGDAAQGPLALPTSSRWRPGVDYDVIAPAQPTNAPPGKVQVMEVFWLACPHCYALEPYMRAWRKSKPNYVQFVRVPVMWGPVQQAHARLFYTLKALDRDDLVETAFNTIHGLETRTGTESIMIGSSQASTLSMQEAFAVRNGVGAAAFENAYNSFDVHAELQRAEQITQLYEIQSVPTIIVDGRYRTDPTKAGGEKQMIALIDFLAKWVHDHRSAP
jgi:thiol:disulfide interchange protein DsbA